MLWPWRDLMSFVVFLILFSLSLYNLPSATAERGSEAEIGTIRDITCADASAIQKSLLFLRESLSKWALDHIESPNEHCGKMTQQK